PEAESVLLQRELRPDADETGLRWYSDGSREAFGRSLLETCQEFRRWVSKVAPPVGHWSERGRVDAEEGDWFVEEPLGAVARARPDRGGDIADTCRNFEFVDEGRGGYGQRRTDIREPGFGAR